MLKIQTIIKNLLTLSVLTMSVIGVNGYAQSATVTPTSAMDSLATPYHAIDVYTCVSTFDWDTYMSDSRKAVEKLNAEIAAGKTNAQLDFNSNPYIENGCIQQTAYSTNGNKVVTTDGNGLVNNVNYNIANYRITANKYGEFTGAGSADAKNILKDIDVLSIRSQAYSTFDIDGKVVTASPSVDRTRLENLGSIYTNDELNRLYGNGTSRTGVPRMVNVGRDLIFDKKAYNARFTDNNPGNDQYTMAQFPCNAQTKSEDCFYDGGTCTANNGKMTSRRKLLTGTPDEVNATAIFAANPNDYQPDSPISNCAWDVANDKGEGQTRIPNCDDKRRRIGTTLMVLDCNMGITQFVSIINYPTQKQCTDYWNIIPSLYEQQCLTHFRNTIGKVLAGNASGTRFVYTHTSYGMWADSSFRCQTKEQTNCDFAPRWGANGNWKNPDVGGPRSNYSTTATEAQLRAFYNDYCTDRNNAPKRCSSVDSLRNRFNGYIRQYDGRSTYVF
jgi:hypothetical protein